MEKEVILSVKNLYVEFGETKVIDNLTFEVRRGDVLVIIGPNGAGKTVLFRALLGLIPFKGEISWQKDMKIGYVPQKISIERDFPISVEEFLGFGVRDKGKIFQALKSVGLEKELKKGFLKERLGVLSQGQLQRILVALAVIDKPNALLFDEPTAGIDIGGEETIYSLLHKLQKEKGLTVIIISHDLNVVYKHANDVLCLNKRKICFGLPKEVLDPKSLVDLYGEGTFYEHRH